MEFTIETTYSQKAVTVMVRTLRKTLRGKKSVHTRLFGGLLAALALFLSLPLDGGPLRVDLNAVMCWAVCAALVFMLLFEDWINALYARGRMLSGARRATAVFSDINYVITTDAGKAEFYYNSNIHALVQTEGYLVFVFDQNHAQVFDKKGLSGGTLEAFMAFIEKKLNKKFVTVR